MFRIDQIVFEDKSYIESMSVMAGQDCFLFSVLESIDSNHFSREKRQREPLIW